MTLPLMEILNMLPVSECAVLSRHRAFSCASAGNRLGVLPECYNAVTIIGVLSEVTDN